MTTDFSVDVPVILVCYNVSIDFEMDSNEFPIEYEKISISSPWFLSFFRRLFAAGNNDAHFLREEPRGS